MAPTVTGPAAVTVSENGSFIFLGTSAVTVDDAEASNSSLQLTLSATNGTLSLATTAGLRFVAGSDDSNSMTATGTLTALDAALNGLEFEPARGYFGSAELEVSAEDTGNAGSSGPLSGSTTVAITIDEVNQPPFVSVPATEAVKENGSITFSSAGDDAITVGDVDSSGKSEQLTLTASHGTLELGSISGLTFQSGANLSASLSVTGTLAALGAAIDGLTFTPVARYIGPATLLVSLDDLDNTGSGGVLTTTEPVAIAVDAGIPTAKVRVTPAAPRAGKKATLDISASDTSRAADRAGFTFDVSFGDGTSRTVFSRKPLKLKHDYAKTGSFVVTVRAIDKFHVTSATAQQIVKVL